MSKRMKKPKGLKLFDQDLKGGEQGGGLQLTKNNPDLDEWRRPDNTVCVDGEWVFLNADQLDKLAERCKAWAKYLRAQKNVKPVPPKKWEDL